MKMDKHLKMLLVVAYLQEIATLRVIGNGEI